MDAIELPAWDGQVARNGRAARQYDGIELLEQVRGGNVDAHVRVGNEGDAFLRHLVNSPLHNVLFQLEVRDAETQQPADDLAALIQA